MISAKETCARYQWPEQIETTTLYTEDITQLPVNTAQQNIID